MRKKRTAENPSLTLSSQRKEADADCISDMDHAQNKEEREIHDKMSEDQHKHQHQQDCDLKTMNA